MCSSTRFIHYTKVFKMFNASILELENQIQYHQEQQELAEQELDRLKMVSAFAEDATDKVSEALEHIDEKYISVFKEHLLSLFTTEASVKEKVAPQEIIEEVEEKLITEVDRTEVPKKFYYELTGRPDLRPPTYEDLSLFCYFREEFNLTSTQNQDFLS